MFMPPLLFQPGGPDIVVELEFDSGANAALPVIPPANPEFDGVWGLSVIL